ncbi:MAG: helix-turn-helix domain-containing protein [Treponema sp.]|nr:helix-turn-helix domain-containing protein [Treponema sp.]
METYLTIEEFAAYLKLAEQTIRRWVLNREVPYCKIRKVIRFRVSEIEKWIDDGGLIKACAKVETDEGGCVVSNDGEDNEVETVDVKETEVVA